MRKKSSSQRRNTYSRYEPRLDISGFTAAEQATVLGCMTGDWIDAAMSLVEEIDIARRCLWFDGQQFEIELNPNGGLKRLDPSIKKSAKVFGLDKNQAERFYGRVCKRVCRALGRSRDLAAPIAGVS